MAKILIHLKISARKLINRCPRKLRPFAGPLLGGLIGLIGGIPGFLIGLFFGYLLRELFVQAFRDRKILDYYENPGSQRFYEAEPGQAAWCALAVLVSAADSTESVQAPASEKILKQVILEASCVFTGPLSDPLLIEHFSRLALSVRDRLNQDLLAESLVARRTLSGDKDVRNLGRALSRLATGEKAGRLAREIRRVLDPVSHDEDSENEQDVGNSGPGINGRRDPWKILGLPPGTPLKEVKSLYRRLAKQFHPDELAVLDEQHREAATRAFIAIKEAYKEIIG